MCRLRKWAIRLTAHRVKTINKLRGMSRGYVFRHQRECVHGMFHRYLRRRRQHVDLLGMRGRLLHGHNWRNRLHGVHSRSIPGSDGSIELHRLPEGYFLDNFQRGRFDGVCYLRRGPIFCSSRSKMLHYNFPD